MNINPDSIKITDKKYLENGILHWHGSFSKATLIKSNSYMFNTLDELFEYFEKLKNILITLKNIIHSEFYCSALSFFYNGKQEAEKDWKPACYSLLFTKNIDLSDNLFLFLQKNKKYKLGGYQQSEKHCLV